MGRGSCSGGSPPGSARSLCPGCITQKIDSPGTNTLVSPFSPHPAWMYSGFNCPGLSCHHPGPPQAPGGRVLPLSVCPLKWEQVGWLLSAGGHCLGSHLGWRSVCSLPPSPHPSHTGPFLCSSLPGTLFLHTSSFALALRLGSPIREASPL